MLDDQTIFLLFWNICDWRTSIGEFFTFLFLFVISYAFMNFPAQMMLSSKKKKQSHFRSVISDIFDGSILSLVQCLTCDRVRCTTHVYPVEGATYQHRAKHLYI